MQKKYHKMLVTDTLLYGIGRGLVSIISFLILPLYTRILGKEGYGLLSLFTSFSSFLIIFFRWGIPTAYTKFYFLKDSEEYKKTLLATSIKGIVFLNIPFIFILLLLNRPISYILTSTNIYGLFVIISIFSTYFSAIHHIPYAKFQTERKVKTYIIYRVVFSVLIVLINLYVLFFTDCKVRNILISSFLVNTIFIFIWIPIYIEGLKNKLDIKLLKEILKFSIPLIIVSFSQWILSMTDRIFLSHYSSIASVGIYSFASKLANILNIGIIYPFAVAWTPLMFMIEKEKNNKEIYARLLNLWILSLFYIAFIIILLSPYIIAIFGGKNFRNSYTPLWIIVSGIFLFGIYQFLTFGPMIKKKTIYLSLITIIAGLINFGLNFVLIPKYGNIGASITFTGSNLIMVILILIVNHKMKVLQFSMRIIIILLFFILIIMLGFITPLISIFIKVLFLMLLTTFIFLILSIYYKRGLL